MKRKADKLDVDKKVPIPVDLSNLSDLVKDDVVTKDVNNAEIRNIEDKIPEITNVAIIASLNAKINEVKGEVPSISNLAKTGACTTAENKISNVINLVKKTDCNTKVMKVKRHLLIMIIVKSILPLQNLTS